VAVAVGTGEGVYVGFAMFTAAQGTSSGISGVGGELIPIPGIMASVVPPIIVARMALIASTNQKAQELLRREASLLEVIRMHL
jgi:uncharacterized membrane protein YfcA